MDVNREIDAKLKITLGELNVQLIVSAVNLEAANRRILRLEERLKKLEPLPDEEDGVDKPLVVERVDDGD